MRFGLLSIESGTRASTESKLCPEPFRRKALGSGHWAMSSGLLSFEGRESLEPLRERLRTLEFRYPLSRIGSLEMGGESMEPKSRLGSLRERL